MLVPTTSPSKPKLKSAQALLVGLALALTQIRFGVHVKCAFGPFIVAMLWHPFYEPLAQPRGRESCTTALGMYMQVVSIRCESEPCIEWNVCSIRRMLSERRLRKINRMYSTFQNHRELKWHQALHICVINSRHSAVSRFIHLGGAKAFV